MLIGPQLYFSEQDSPFYAGIQAGTIYLENFEDQALDTPFVSEPSGVDYFGTTARAFNPDALRGTIWSVDGDDGAVDGETFDGDTWITLNSCCFTRANRMGFDFQPNGDGLYPSFVGIVVTRVSDFDNDVDLTVLDTRGLSVFADSEFDPMEWSPPGGTGPGSPLLQRFIGFQVDGGITAIRVSNVSQLDHLQYGYAIPEPSAGFFIMLSLIFPLLSRRR